MGPLKSMSPKNFDFNFDAYLILVDCFLKLKPLELGVVHIYVYVPVIFKTLEHIETFNTNYKDSS